MRALNSINGRETMKDAICIADSLALGAEKAKETLFLRISAGPGTFATIAAGLELEIPDRVNSLAFKAGFFNVVDKAFGHTSTIND